MPCVSQEPPAAAAPASRTSLAAAARPQNDEARWSWPTRIPAGHHGRTRANPRRAKLAARSLRYDVGTSYRSPARAGILVFFRAGVVQWQNVSFPS
jgi:hypothetical protein